MVTSLEMCQQIWANPYAQAAAWKEKTGGKVLGWWPMYAPEELIHAAGLLPVFLHGAHEPVTLANSHLESFYCPPLRLMMDSFLKGNFKDIDGAVFVKVDDEAARAAEIIDILNLKPVFFFRRPKVIFKPIWQESLKGSMRRLKVLLEQFTRRRIDEEAISRSISLYNKNRSLLRRIYDMRSENPGLLPARDMLAIVASSLFMPKEDNNQLLEKLISELSKAPGPAKKIKVALAGGLCDDPPQEILDTIEEAGMSIVDDELFFGRRYFNDDVSTSVPPLDALSQYQWEKAPCPSAAQSEVTYADYLVDFFKRSGADGLIYLEWKFCKLQLWEHAALADAFKNASVPTMTIQVGEEAVAHEAIRTRLEAFAESIRGGR